MKTFPCISWAAVLTALGMILSQRDVLAQTDRRFGTPARTESSKRVALVIGNDTYAGAPLRNAVNDAVAIAAALRDLGFAVDIRTNVGSVGLEQAIRGFAGRLSPGDVAFFFFAGHGVQIENENYLIPIDFDAQNEVEAKHKSYGAELLRDLMERSGSKLNVIVLDACRDNPFRFSRSGRRGLGTMETARGTLIALATGPGRTASDNQQAKNGLFTMHLLDALKTPGLKIQDVFENVKAAVDEASGHQQIPWVLSNVIGEFYLITSRTAQVGPIPGSVAGDRELAFWNSIAGSDDPRDFEEYLRKYPNGDYLVLARNRVERLRTRTSSSVPLATLPKEGSSRDILAVIDMDRVSQESVLGKSYAAQEEAVGKGLDRDIADARREALKKDFKARIKPMAEQLVRERSISGLVDNQVALFLNREFDMSSDLIDIASERHPSRTGPPSRAPFLAMINMEKVSSESALGRGYAAQIQGLEREIQTEGTKKQAELNRLDAEIRNITDAQTRGEKTRQREAFVRDGQAELQRMREQAKAKAQGLNKEFQQKIKPHIDAVAREKGIDIILDSQVALTLTREFDISSAVIDLSDGRSLPTRSALRAPRMAVVDMERISAECVLGKGYAAQIQGLEREIQTEGTKKQAELAKMDAAIKALQDELDKQAAVLSPEAVERRRQDFVKKTRDRQAYVEDGQQELQRMREQAEAKAQGLNNEFQQKIKPHIAAVVREKGIDILLTSSVMLAPTRSLDVSHEVILRANAAEDTAPPS